MTIIVKIFLQVFLTTACLSVTDRDVEKIDHARIAFSKQSRMGDRGYMARKNISMDDLMSKDLTFIDQYYSTLEKELECGFVFSVLVHINLLGIYLTDPKLDNLYNLLTPEEVNNITFAEEALYIINYAFDNGKPSLLQVMWIYYFLDLRTYNFINSFEYEPLSDIHAKFSAEHADVRKMLEEFTESYECKVYNEETGEPQAVKYADKMKEYMERPRRFPLSLESNKLQFSNQRGYNTEVYTIKEPIKLQKHLSYYHPTKDSETTDELLSFGVNVDRNRIVDHFLRRYQGTYKFIVPFHQYIDLFITIQHEFIATLKAVALRFVLAIVNYMRKMSASHSPIKDFFMLNNVYGENYKKITAFLTKFASCIDQHDDRHLNKVKRMFKTSFPYYRTVSQFDKCINSVMSSLKEITSDDSDIATLSIRIKEEDYDRVENMINEIMQKYCFMILQGRPELKVLKVADIFINYVEGITGNIAVMNSLFRLQESDSYKRLVDLEKGAD